MRNASRIFCVFFVVFCALATSAVAFAQAPFSAFTPFPASGSAGAAPQIVVTLSSPAYFIRADSKTGAPLMPRDVSATAALVNWPDGATRPTTFTWHVYLDWKMPGWDGFETRHPIDAKIFTDGYTFRPDLSGAVRGGTLIVYAKTTLRGQEIVGAGRASVLGFNPSRRAVLAAFPVSRFGLIASKVGEAESGLRQFTASSLTAAGGQPVVSSSGDVGVMQLNAPTGAITSSDQVWDWRQNVRRGLEMLAGKGRTSVIVARGGMGRGWQRPAENGLQCLANLNVARLILGMPALPAPEAPPLSALPNSGVLPGEADPDHITLSQLERDAIRRYNGGREYAFTIIPNPDTLTIARAGWEVDPTRGGMRSTSGALNYVTRVLASRSGMIYPPQRPKAGKREKGRGKRKGRFARHSVKAG